MEKWNYTHQFIVKNNVDYIEIIQIDLYNYYECNCPVIFIEKENAILYKIGQKKLTLKIKKLNKNISQIGKLIIDTAFSEGKSRIDITTEDKKVITVYEKLSRIFLEDVLIEVE
jgi:sensor domain CHASE-containing protein